MDKLDDLPGEDVNALCSAPLCIYFLIKATSNTISVLKDFELLRAIEKGIGTSNTSSDILVDHFKSNLDKYFSLFSADYDTRTLSECYLSLSKLRNIVDKHPTHLLGDYLLDIYNFARYQLSCESRYESTVLQKRLENIFVSLKLN